MKFRATVVDPALHPHHEGVEFLLIPTSQVVVWGLMPVSSLERMQRVVDWCTEQFGEQGDRWAYEPDLVVIFYKKSDAVLFRLAWIEDDAHLPT